MTQGRQSGIKWSTIAHSEADERAGLMFQYLWEGNALGLSANKTLVEKKIHYPHDNSQVLHYFVMALCSFCDFSSFSTFGCAQNSVRFFNYGLWKSKLSPTAFTCQSTAQHFFPKSYFNLFYDDHSQIQSVRLTFLDVYPHVLLLNKYSSCIWIFFTL